MNGQNILIVRGQDGRDFLANQLRDRGARVDYLAAALTGANPQMTVADATPRAELVLATLNGLTIRYLVDPAFDLAAHVEVLREIATA